MGGGGGVFRLLSYSSCSDNIPPLLNEHSGVMTVIVQATAIKPGVTILGHNDNPEGPTCGHKKPYQAKKVDCS